MALAEERRVVVDRFADPSDEGVRPAYPPEFQRLGSELPVTNFTR